MKNTHPKRTYIFDYGDRARSVELKPVAIIAISVTILSGDETIDVYYEDGTVEFYDICPNCGSFMKGEWITKKKDYRCRGDWLYEF